MMPRLFEGSNNAKLARIKVEATNEIDNVVFCKICYESFPSQEGLANHVRVEHIEAYGPTADHKIKNEHQTYMNYYDLLPNTKLEIVENNVEFGTQDVSSLVPSINSFEDNILPRSQDDSKTFSEHIEGKRDESILVREERDIQNTLKLPITFQGDSSERNPSPSYTRKGERTYKKKHNRYKKEPEDSIKTIEKIYKNDNSKIKKLENCGKEKLLISNCDKLFLCHICGNIYKKRSSLNKHLKKHTKPHLGERWYTCSHCDYVNVAKDQFRTHMKTHKTHTKPFECDSCGYKCRQKYRLIQHMNVHTGYKPYACDICEYRSYIITNLRIHLRRHSGEKPYKCPFCDKKFSQTGSRKSHIRTHTDEKPYTCHICDFRFRQQSNLVAHVRSHRVDRPFECTICGCRLKEKYGLTKHMRLHTDGKRYSCDNCKYRCKEKRSLVVHMRLHMGIKLHACHICDYKFNQKTHLTAHIRTHTREKPYACKYCDYKCKEKSALTKHLRSHTGEKPFACSRCAYKCKEKKTLNKHMKTHSNSNRK